MSLFDAAGHVHVPAAGARGVRRHRRRRHRDRRRSRRCSPAASSLRDAMPIANRAGGIVVGKFGTASVELRGAVRRGARMRVVVTGAAGMIGSNLVHGPERDRHRRRDRRRRPDRRRQVPQPARRAHQPTTSTGATSTRASRAASSARVDAVLHEGACSDTMEHDGRYMLDNNYRCSKDLLDACQAQGTRLLYASSAATYGGSAPFREEPEFEQPLNVYGYSKLLFDNVVRRMLPTRDRRRSRAFATSTSTARASSTRAAWRRSRSTTSTSSADDGKVKLFGDVRRLRRRASRRATSSSSTTWSPSTSGSSSIPRRAASSTSAPAGPSRSTTSPRRSSTRCAPQRGEPRAAARRARRARHRSSTSPFPDALVGKYQCFTAGRPDAAARASAATTPSPTWRTACARYAAGAERATTVDTAGSPVNVGRERAPS